MKNFIFTFALMLTFSFAAQAQFIYKPKVKVQPKHTIKTYPKINPNLLQRNCPDLAAVELRVQKTSGNQHRGVVRITGVVKNVGKQHFVSGGGQAYAYLYEVSLTGRSTLKARRQITNLSAGRSFSLGFSKNWYAGNEFPPNYKLVISYDPDIKLDSNPRNDDCNSANNQMTRTGHEVTQLFRAGR
ncbi:MAG: hypothetical protein Sapg2KO_01300 [Saprospiraceae bacterium]